MTTFITFHQQNYDDQFLREVKSGPLTSIEDLKNGLVTANGTARVPYYDDHDFKEIAQFLGIMDDLRVKHSAKAKKSI